MPDGTDVTYCYDGTFDGLLSCVFAAFERHETPVAVLADDNTFLPVKHIDTDPTKAARVKKGIAEKIGETALENVRLCFLAADEKKELTVLNYLRYGFRYGRKIYTDISDPSVMPVVKLVKTMRNEAHRMKEFVRFSDYGDALVSVIEPVNNVLPLIVGHFCDRLPKENFMIYDEGRGAAFVHTPESRSFITLDELTLPPESQEEKKFRRLWKLFYDTVEIKERHSDRRRMQHCPKQYWKNMTEFTYVSANDSV